MEWRKGGAVLASQPNAVAHERTGHTAAAPGRMHRDGSDSVRRHRLPTEELPTWEEHVAADDLAVDMRQPEWSVRRGGEQPAHVGRNDAGERLGVDLRKASELRLALHVADLDRWLISFHERPSVLALAAPPTRP